MWVPPFGDRRARPYAHSCKSDKRQCLLPENFLRIVPDMQPLPTPDDIRAEAAKAGVTIARLCELAGLQESHFHRWAKGQSPKMRTVEKFVQAINSLQSPQT